MLPKLVTPKYDMIVPSTGESITYRPYVVKEEKILLIAMETESEIAIEKAVQDIIKACVESPININELTNYVINSNIEESSDNNNNEDKFVIIDNYQ